jgi:hypothetical protein
MKINFIADFFSDQVLGGGELNNKELIDYMISDGHEVTSINSHMVTSNFIERNSQDCFIVANFINLNKESIVSLYDKKYIIYEHDHKYLTTRDPSKFKDFAAPPEAIINQGFYRKAHAVLCQSQYHLDIVSKNLQDVNLISLGGNLWPEASLDLMSEISELPKKDAYAIMDSDFSHKNTSEAVAYCEHKKLQYTLIKSDSYEEFLKMMGENKTFVFLPKTPETLSRIVVEARMMGMSVIVNKMIGATREEWYKQKGKDLIDTMRKKRTEIKDLVVRELS